MPPSRTRMLPLRRSLLLAPLAWALPSLSRPAPAQSLIPPALMGQASQLFATLIHVGRENAIAAGVRPVPPGLYRALLGFFPDRLLRRARHVTGPMENIGIPGLAMSYGDITAMTLGEVIVFRDETRAREDAKLWAHELTHVLQYERWGIEGFAERYLEDSEAVEQEARDNADRYVRWSRQARH